MMYYINDTNDKSLKYSIDDKIKIFNFFKKYAESLDKNSEDYRKIMECFYNGYIDFTDDESKILTKIYRKCIITLGLAGIK